MIYITGINIKNKKFSNEVNIDLLETYKLVHQNQFRK